MLRAALLAMILTWSGLTHCSPRVVDDGALLVLAYHDVVRDVRTARDRHAIDLDELVAHFAWLRSNGFAVVSLGQVIAARAGGVALPKRPVLLTFDDGYRSHYTAVFPLLKLYNYPAVFAIVGSWLEIAAGGEVPFAPGAPRKREDFMRWSELHEMAGSGLVEIASHSFDLHRGILGNRHGNLQPAATTRTYDAPADTYESDAAYRTRVRTDLARNSALIEQRVGTRPRAIVWPFGSFNGDTLAVAARLGMPVTFTLQDGINPSGQPLDRLRRIMIERNLSARDLAWSVEKADAIDPRRLIHISLDDLYARSVDEQEQRLSAVLDRLHRMQVSTVVLSGLSDASGGATSAYFPNRALPMRADLFNRAAWQMTTRLRVQVLARLSTEADVDMVPLYEDLARYSHFHGFYFEAGDRAQSATLLQAASRFRAPLHSIVRMDLAEDDETAAKIAWQDAFKLHDQVALAIGRERMSPIHLARAARMASASGPNRARVVVELELERGARDPIGASRVVSTQLSELKRLGAIHLGYRTDSPHDDYPRMDLIRGALSLGAHPQ